MNAGMYVDSSMKKCGRCTSGTGSQLVAAINLKVVKPSLSREACSSMYVRAVAA